MTNNHIELIKFVLESAETAPVRRRIAVYRGLADLIGVPAESAKLLALAEQLEKAETATRQFAFDFSLKH